MNFFQNMISSITKRAQKFNTFGSKTFGTLHKDINKILLAGGVSHKLDFIEELFENYYSIETRKIHRNDETILGLRNIIKDIGIS